jgi:hypothetical protein
MSIHNSQNLEEQREEAINLFISVYKDQTPFIKLGDETARQICIGADKLLEYIKNGKIPEMDMPKKG